MPEKENVNENMFDLTFEDEVESEEEKNVEDKDVIELKKPKNKK